MRTVIVSVIGISSLFLVFIMQQKINQDSWLEEEFEDSVSMAMNDTVTEMTESEQNELSNQNEWMAFFLQSMIMRLDREIDLTVKIYCFDSALGQIDVEVIGRCEMADGKEIVKSIRRKLVVKSKRRAI